MALLAVALAAGLSSCAGRRALVLIDAYLPAIAPDYAAALREFKPAGYVVEVVDAPEAGTAAFIQRTLAARRPDYVLASPGLLAEIRKSLPEGSRAPVATIGIGVDRPETPVVLFGSAAAYRALGRLMGAAIVAYNASHTDRAVCGAIFQVGTGRPRSWMDEFRRGFAELASGADLAIRIVGGDSPDTEESAIAALESLNLRAILVAPGDRFFSLASRFPSALIVADDGLLTADFAPVDAESDDAAPAIEEGSGNAAVRASLAATVHREPRTAVQALERRLSTPSRTGDSVGGTEGAQAADMPCTLRVTRYGSTLRLNRATLETVFADELRRIGSALP